MQSEQLPFQDHLVRGLTHRMNNILTLFHGYVGILLDREGLDRATRDGLNKIQEGARAASELMDRTHALVRPSAVVWREAKLEEFIPLLKNSFDTFAGPNTSITVEIAEKLPPIRADLARLKNALLELVRNACEAAPRGQVTIQVRCDSFTEPLPSSSSNASHPIHWVTINVIDDGPGFDAEMAGKIFEPFFSTKPRQNAAGLGLNVASGCIQQIGGLLKFDSQPGHTRFQILLPAIV